MATFNIQGKVLKKSTQLGISLATVQVFHLGDPVPVAEAETALDGRFAVSFPWSGPGRPDVHFRVLQSFDGARQTIYNENPATATRFNIADVLSVTLRTDQGLTAMPPTTGRPYDQPFLFTRVGNIGMGEIDAVGDGASGYAWPDDRATTPNPATANAPFGATLDLAGWFGAFAGIDAYKIQYDDGSGYRDVTDPLVNSYYEFAPGGGGSWNPVVMGPIDDLGQTHVYKLPYVERPGAPWSFPDRIAQWDTTKVGNTLHKLRVLGFRLGADGLLEAVAPLAGASYAEIRLRVDNSPPVARITSIQHEPTPGAPFATVSVCQIVPFIAGRLRINVEASDSQGHLGGYTLSALFGHNEVVSPPPAGASNSYASFSGPGRLWNGGAVGVDYSGAAYPPDRMRTCAYQFRLNVSKRTTNGYNPLYAGEDTVHLTLQRP